MRIFAIFVILHLFSCATLLGQRSNIFYCSYASSQNTKVFDICKGLQNNFAVNNDAEKAVDRILAPLGLPRNFVLLECDNIKNAVAITSGDGIRYIVYDNKFMEGIDKSTSNWSSISILAHEIGHHLCGHTLTASATLVDQRQKELEADEFSGFVMFKLGATLQQAQSAINLVTTDADDTYSTHPSRFKRLGAIKKGFDRAQSQAPVSNINNSPSAENAFNQGKIFYDQKKYTDAISKFTYCLSINKSFADAWFFRGSARVSMQLSLGITDCPDAMYDYDKAVELKYGFAYLFRGNLKAMGRNYRGALTDYSNFITLYSDMSRGYERRAGIKIKLLDFQGALTDYNTSISLDPSNGSNYFQRGLLKRDKLNDKAGACNDFSLGCQFGNKDCCEYKCR